MTAPLPPPKRILLIRLSAFGDVVIATGLLHALKRAQPQAEIDWLVQPEFAGLLRTQPAIANVMVWERKQWGALWRGFRWLALWQAIHAFASSLRARDYDWVIDAQGLLKSRALARLAGGRMRIGYDGKEPGKFWLHRVIQRFPEASPERRHIGDEHAPMLHALVGSGDCIPQLELPAAAAATPYLVAAPFTTRPQKHWPETHWISLLKSLAAAGHRVLILGGPADAPAAERLLAGCGHASIESLAGRTSFVAAAECIASARAVIGVDTGLTHLGFALGRPTLALFGSTRPYAAARGPGSAVLFRALPCAPCGRHPSCNGRWDCMAQLRPEAVAESLQSLLKQAESAHRSSTP
ncbi:MAG: glycosyltransferase family 9 protein [Pseudomonadota bacterium]